MDSRASDKEALVGVSTGSLARYPNGGDPVVLAGYLADIEADAVEVLFYRGFHDDLERAAQAFRSCGRPIRVVHAEKNLGTAFGSPDPAQVADGQRRFLEALWLAQQVGAQLVTLHLWDRPESDRNLERNFAALEPLLPRVQDAGMAVGLETIPCTVYNPVDNVHRALTHFGGLAAGCAVTLDLEFLGWHDCVERGVNGAFADLEHSAAFPPHNSPHELMEEVRQDHSLVLDVHVRDYDGQPFTAEGRRRYLDPGQGQLDFPAIFSALVADGFRGPFMYEGSHTPVSGDGDVSAINAVLANMRRWLADADRAAAPAARGATPPTVTV